MPPGVSLGSAATTRTPRPLSATALQADGAGADDSDGARKRLSREQRVRGQRKSAPSGSHALLRVRRWTTARPATARGCSAASRGACTCCSKASYESPRRTGSTFGSHAAQYRLDGRGAVCDRADRYPAGTVGGHRARPRAVGAAARGAGRTPTRRRQCAAATAGAGRAGPAGGNDRALLERVRSTIARERRFADDAAHELPTPLSAVKTLLQVLRLSLGRQVQPAVADALAHPDEGVRRMQRSLEQLLFLRQAGGQ